VDLWIIGTDLVDVYGVYRRFLWNIEVRFTTMGFGLTGDVGSADIIDRCQFICCIIRLLGNCGTSSLVEIEEDPETIDS